MERSGLQKLEIMKKFGFQGCSMFKSLKNFIEAKLFHIFVFISKSDQLDVDQEP
jgi:hypothetical protein